jgi:membrane protease YdiL (CAAX protease family)
MKAIKGISIGNFAGRIALALLLGSMAIIFAGLLAKLLGVPAHFPMDLVLLVVATWIMYKTDHKSLDAIGLNFRPRNMAFLFLGLLIGAVAVIVISFAGIWLAGGRMVYNQATDYSALWHSLLFIIPSCAIQELMFRGYCFTKTIEFRGVAMANIIFALLFMLVHVVDRDVLKNPGQMIMLIVAIPVGHLWFATALVRSKTLYFPIGLHWGNNWISLFVITNAKTATTVWYRTGLNGHQGWPVMIGGLLIFDGFFLLITYLIWKWPVHPSAIKTE